MGAVPQASQGAALSIPSGSAGAGPGAGSAAIGGSLSGGSTGGGTGGTSGGTGGTTAGWYRFRAAWGGRDGWIAQLKVYAALHNHAGLYNPEFAPPPGPDAHAGWASGAWFIGPDGRTLGQMPSSTQKTDSKEFILIHNIPIGGQ